MSWLQGTRFMAVLHEHVHLRRDGRAVWGGGKCPRAACKQQSQEKLVGCHLTDLWKEAPGEDRKCWLTYGLEVLIDLGEGVSFSCIKSAPAW